MSDLMREEFEAWAITNAFLGLSESCMERHNEGYLGCELHAAWEAWKASRECLVVDLQEDFPFSKEPKYQSSRQQTISECRAAIHAAGVKAK